MKRSSFTISAEMLRAARNGAKKTRITNSCNLSNHITNKFLKSLIDAGLLREGSSFITTEKGRQFLQAYQTLDLLLNTRTYLPSSSSRPRML